MKSQLLNSLLISGVILSVGIAPVAAAESSYTIVDLGTLGGAESRAFDLNDQGQVIGESVTPAGELHAFLWEAGTLTDLGTLGGGLSSAAALNERGQVIGVSSTAAADGHAFLWRRGVMTDLELPYRVSDIKNSGRIVGATAEVHAFVWLGGQVTDL